MCITRSFSIVTVCLAATAAGAQTPNARITRDDIQFMQMMIDHHAQAIRIAKLAADHSANADVKTIAASVATTHGTEITQMQRWLQKNRQPWPDPSKGQLAMPGLKLPGMVAEQDVMDLEERTGPSFDRLFLTDMIAHHQGALTMRTELGTATGSGQEPELLRFLSNFESRERAELGRLRALLAKTP